MAKPITPEDVADKKLEAMPEAVIEAFNELIVKGWDGRCATVVQDEVINRIIGKMQPDNPSQLRTKIFANHWLDVEDIYRKSGWKVEYDEPGFNESYPATFEFSKKHKER